MKKRMNVKNVYVAGKLLSAAILAFVLVSCGDKQVNFNTAKATDQVPVEVTVMATGTVQPVEVVEVGTQVSGVIEKIYADYNSQVKKGQLLAELDKLTLQEKLNQANASLTSSRSELVYAKQNHDRVKRLYELKAATQVSYEEAVNRLVQAQTSVETAQANVHQARVNLSYASVYSPIDGVIMDRSVNVGQTVAASFSTPTLFKIAEDLTKMQVEADVDEADIGMVKLGQKVYFTVDAYNGDVFDGTVSQVRIQPKITSNVVTYTVIIEAPNPDEKLFPGMTANIDIEVNKENGISIPMEALRYANSRTQVVVYKDGATQLRDIITGIDDGIYTIVRSGLEYGEEVVLSTYVGKKNNKESENNSFLSRK